jgi:hypothetical protein
LLAVGPIYLNTKKRRTDLNGKELKQDAVTARGVLVATATTLSAALGQLWVGWRALSIDSWWWWCIPIATLILLLAFALQTTRRSLYRGSNKPAKDPEMPADAIVAAAMAIVVQQHPTVSPTELAEKANALAAEMVKDIDTAYPDTYFTSLGDAPAAMP